MAVIAAQLKAELKRLRRDEGRTLVKLQASQQVIEALNVPQDRDLLAAFDDAVQLLGLDLRSLALKNAYGIGQRNPGILTTRRETFAAQPSVNRSPDTVMSWENEKIDELVARLRAGELKKKIDRWLVAVAIEKGRIVVVGEGAADTGSPMQQLFNPVMEPFIPAFLYQLPRYVTPDKLTVSLFFMDDVPTDAWAAASGSLLACICGDGRQHLVIESGGIPGLEEAVAHLHVHWNSPQQGEFYLVKWLTSGPGALMT